MNWCAKEVTKLSPATTVGFAASLSDTKEREHCLQQKKGWKEELPFPWSITKGAAAAPLVRNATIWDINKREEII